MQRVARRGRDDIPARRDDRRVPAIGRNAGQLDQAAEQLFALVQGRRRDVDRQRRGGALFVPAPVADQASYLDEAGGQWVHLQGPRLYSRLPPNGARRLIREAIVKLAAGHALSQAEASAAME